jgi:hypothetical protein
VGGATRTRKTKVIKAIQDFFIKANNEQKFPIQHCNIVHGWNNYSFIIGIVHQQT